MSRNIVLESTKCLIEKPKYVFIELSMLEKVAEDFSKENLTIPSWNFPVFIKGTTGPVIDFFLLGNAINFAYTDFKTGLKWKAEYAGEEWEGAFGMWACLKGALENGYPLLEGEYLKEISERDMIEIFKGNFKIPLFKERLQIFREVGRVLCEKYGGYFHNLIARSNRRLFNNGAGIVERLTSDFVSFDDSLLYKGKRVRFDKRAQLGPGMLCGRFKNQGLLNLLDVNELTVFADYVLPKALRDLGIILYEDSLANRVDKKMLIPAQSQEELEIRATTVHASKMIIDRINEFRATESINALHLDYKLWSESRKKPGPHHLTITTAY